MRSPHSDQCLGIIHQGVQDMQRGSLGEADHLFCLAMKAAPTLPKDDAFNLFPLTACYLSLLRMRQNKTKEAGHLHGMAMAALDAIERPLNDGLFQALLAEALKEMKEYRRAIPFFESTAQAFADAADPLGVANMLSNAGQCYSRCGLKDRGAVPLRAAVKIYRGHPGDPHLPGVLLDLGNALSKSSPGEAERAYLEASAWYESKMHLESAAPAWVNLGVLCSKQGRNAEALAWYEKALDLRERSSSTPPVRIAVLLNNIANCHRRSGDFVLAHQLLDRAMRLFPADNHVSLGSAFGTRGLIYRDEGRDAEAVVWLRKAREERGKMPSPDLDAIAGDLESEIGCLRILDRMEEAIAAEAVLAATHDVLSYVPQAEIEFSLQAKRVDGAVLIELDCSSRPGTRYTVSDAVALAERLSTVAEAHLAGSYAGRVMIPESTTLMFYGPNAEALFFALETVLEADRVCEGARVTVRQGSRVRELGIPARVM